ncbi:putative glycosyl transferase [bacterium BMS3Abin03]|nr:putative glycosyl transferase [bacterium BMS3Abin03]
MKILIYAHFYYPEVGAASLRMQYFVNALKNDNNEIKIIAPLPNYPLGYIYKGFSKFFQKDEKRGIIYLPIYLPKKHSLIKRGLSYFSFFCSSFFYTLFSSYKADIIISSSPPISTSFAAALISKLKGIRFIIDLRDIWPDIGIELGLLKRKSVINILTKIEKFILRTASVILVTAEGDKANIVKKGIDEEKIKVIYNGADSSVFKPVNESDKLSIREKYRIPINKIVLIYFGSFNYGMNDIDLLGNVLSKLDHDKENIFFVAIGNGDNLNDFLMKIKGKINFLHLDSMSIEEIAKLVAASDLSLIPRKKILIDTGGNTPVKIFESWAAGVPVLLSADLESETAKIFKKCEAGVLVEPGNEEEYLQTLEKLIVDPVLSALGKKGRPFVIENFDRMKQAEKLTSIIKEI